MSSYVTESFIQKHWIIQETSNAHVHFRIPLVVVGVIQTYNSFHILFFAYYIGKSDLDSETHYHYVIMSESLNHLLNQFIKNTESFGNKTSNLIQNHIGWIQVSH